MAVFGYLSDLLVLYQDKDPKVRKGLEYLAKLKIKTFKGAQAGLPVKEEIEGGVVFVVHQTYLPKPLSAAKFEGHRAYIDIQYIISGREVICLAQKPDCKSVVPYDRKKDIEFFQAKRRSTLILRKGMAAIFYPHDIHAPSLIAGTGEKVRKSVVKVKIA